MCNVLLIKSIKFHYMCKLFQTFMTRCYCSYVFGIQTDYSTRRLCFPFIDIPDFYFSSDSNLQSKVKDLPNERSIFREKTSISNSIPPDSCIYHQSGDPSPSSLPKPFVYGSTGDIFDSSVSITRNPFEDKARRRSSVGNYLSGRSFAGLSGEHSFRSESTLASDLSWHHSSPKTNSTLHHHQNS